MINITINVARRIVNVGAKYEVRKTPVPRTWFSKDGYYKPWPHVGWSAEACDGQSLNRVGT